MKYDNDCATHGNSEIAKKKFWKNTYTCHWSCKCKQKELSKPNPPTVE